MNIIVQLWDQLIECPLLGFHAGLLCGLDSGYDSGKLADLHDALIEVVLVLLLDLELELGERVVDLAVQVDHVADVLEVHVDVVEVAGLLHELVHILDLLRQVRDALSQPLLLHVSPLADHLRQQRLNLADKVLGGGKQGRPTPLRIDLQKTNVCHRRQVRIEKGVVVFEELDGIGKGLSGVLESFIDQQGKIGLLVSPIDLKQGLEASKELFDLIECALNDVTDNVFMIDVQLVLLNP